MLQKVYNIKVTYLCGSSSLMVESCVSLSLGLKLSADGELCLIKGLASPFDSVWLCWDPDGDGV